MSRDYTFDTFTKNRRNRTISAGFKSNPNHPLYTQEIMLQAISGTVPIYSVSSNGSTLKVDTPCICNTPVGFEPEKDMDNTNYTDEFDPNEYQSTLFPGLADFIDENIITGDKDPGDRLIASYWNDLGNDVFDDWGYFYLYDPAAGQYYFPLINPQNQADGTLTTQVFNAFGRTFTIIHGWAAQGIFKFDISVADSLPFRFGAYGNMGFDSHGIRQNLEEMFHVHSKDLNLFYHHSYDIYNQPQEQLFSYFIPKVESERMTKAYEVYYVNDIDDNMNIMTKEVTNGIVIYFSKGVDTKQWIVYDVIDTLQ